MTAPDTHTLAGLLARLRGQDPIPSRSEVADAIEALAVKDKARIERLEAALRKMNVGDGWAARIARAALEDEE